MEAKTSRTSPRAQPGPVRQIAIADLGREQSTLLLTNQTELAYFYLIERYARLR